MSKKDEIFEIIKLELLKKGNVSDILRNSLSELIDDIEQKEAQLGEIIKSNDKEIKKLNEERNSLLTEIGLLIKDNKSLIVEKNNLIEENSKLIEAEESIQKDYESFKKEYESLEKEIKELQKECEDLKKEHHFSQSEYDALLKDLDYLKRENQALLDAKKYTEQKAFEMTQELEKQLKILEIQNKIDSQNKEINELKIVTQNQMEEIVKKSKN